MKNHPKSYLVDELYELVVVGTIGSVELGANYPAQDPAQLRWLVGKP